MSTIILGEIMANFNRTKKGPVPHKVLSDRGVFLEQAHDRQQCSSIGFGQKVVVGQNDNGEDIVVTQGQKCPSCRMRVRGPDHVNGMHHRGTVRNGRR